METAGTTETMWCASRETRSIVDSDGAIILDLLSGKFCGLNPTGARIWQVLQNNGPSTRSSLVATLVTELNSRPCDLERHVDHFLSTMSSKAFVRQVGKETDCLEGGKSSGAIFEDKPAPASSVTHESTPARPARLVGLTAMAAIGLTVAQALLKLGGFRALHRVVRRWPVRSRRNPDLAWIGKVSAATSKASRFCPRRVWCLERAAVIVCLLRWRGLPAEFVIGCQRVPFASHAWAEVLRAPVNEDPQTIPLYRAIERC